MTRDRKDQLENIFYFSAVFAALVGGVIYLIDAEAASHQLKEEARWQEILGRITHLEDMVTDMKKGRE